jgi:aminoglycoside N3'-acetyltransferase
LTSRTILAEQLRALGVEPGDVLLVHSSYRAVRPVEDGPAGLIAALQEAVGESGTIVMPAWTEDDDSPFDPASTPVSTSLGVVPATFARSPGVVRSAHPFACAAIGRHAAAIIADDLPIPPHRLESPVGRVWEMDGRVLLLGVGHDSDTTIHLAESFARVPYGVPKHCTVLKEGRATRIDYLENDHCCQRFALADEWLTSRGLQREGRVGGAHARLVRSRDVVDVVRERLTGDPLVFLHAPDAGCAECNEARDSILAVSDSDITPRR